MTLPVTLSVMATPALLALGVVHTLWAFGIWWPGGDERRLVSRVIGIAGAERMPGPIPSGMVALGLAIAAALPWLPDGWPARLGLGLATGIFLFRGLITWTPRWRRATPQEPFATLDQRYYGPLCLAFAAAFALILAERIA